MAIHRFDAYCAIETGLMAQMRFENGVELNIDGMISEELTDDVHVYVILQGKLRYDHVCVEDLVKMEEQKIKKRKR